MASTLLKNLRQLCLRVGQSSFSSLPVVKSCPFVHLFRIQACCTVWNHVMEKTLICELPEIALCPHHPHRSRLCKLCSLVPVLTSLEPPRPHTCARSCGQIGFRGHLLRSTHCRLCTICSGSHGNGEMQATASDTCSTPSGILDFLPAFSKCSVFLLPIQIILLH